MEQFLSKVMLEGADDPSIKEAFLQSAGEMSDRGDVLNLNAARVIISVFSNATLVRQLLQNLDRLKPIFNLKTSLTGVLVGALNEMTAAYDERVLCDAMLCDGFWGERVNDTIALLEKGSDGIFWPVQFAKLYPILYERHFASDLLEAEGDRPLNFEKEERRFEGSFEGMVFRLPANIREFVQRGPPQHTVLTDRLERFGYGQLLVLAVYEAGQHRYTCDITPQGELLEIRSHNQQALTSQVIMKIGAFLDFVATRAKTI
jgi:hypothetical protein